MTKQLKKYTLSYTEAEREAEAEIDTFLRHACPPSSRSILDDLKSFE